MNHKKLLNFFSTNRVTISIGTIKDEDSNLNILGKLANETQGRVKSIIIQKKFFIYTSFYFTTFKLFVLDPSKLDEIVYEFTESTSVLTILATNMELTIIAPEDL